MTTIVNNGVPRLVGFPDVAPHSLPGTRANRISDAGADLALLICVLFLGRFTLTFGHSLMELNIVPIVLIFAHQFISGRLLILKERLLWLLSVAFVVTCSLLLNFASTMLPSYCLFIVTYTFFTLNRPSTVDRYQSTLRAFQLLMAILSVFAIGQFAAQFVVDGRKLIEFYDSGQCELYDLAADPSETKNLASASPDEVSRLRNRFAEWKKDAVH